MSKLNLSSIYRFFASLIIAAVIIPASTVFGQTTYTIAKSSTMTVFGTSNIHDWECDVEQIDGTIQVEEGTIQNVKVTIPVKSMDSGKGGMNSNMYKALKADDHENIMFELESTEIVSGDAASQMVLSASGQLTIAGETNTITMEVNGEKTDNGYTFSGKQIINMTDYDVDPPTAMFGTISTGEEVTIEFTIHTETTATH